jgi:trans-aconitate 2-methyltransferase
MPDWNPELYLKFFEQRTRPALDLALRARSLLEEGASGGAAAPKPAALDLGCGPGNSTAVLATVFPGAELVGLDSSPEMIAAAKASGLDAEWVLADAVAWKPERSFGLVFSNAALQWIPDQASLIPRIWGHLAPGGVLAVQVPGNGESGLHRALRRTARSGPWRSRFADMDDPISYHEPDFYYEALAPLSGSVDVWESSYWHLLAGRSALIDWYSGTGMRPWLDRLADEAERLAFKDAVLEAARADYPPRADGSVFFTFRRIFFTATKAR